MKKIYLIFVALVIVSCEPEAKIDYAIISGKITNTTSKKASLVKQADRSLVKEITLAEDGSFNDTIKLNKGSLYAVYQGRNTTNLYLSAGDNISINYDAKERKKTIEITGKGSEYASYLSNKALKYKESIGEGTDIYTKEENEYLKTFKDIKQSQEDLLYNTEGISEEFKQLEKKNINYGFLSNLNKYKSYHSYYAKKPDFKTSEGFLDELDALDYTNEDDFNFSSNYNGLVTSNYRKMAEELIKTDSLEYDIAMLTVSGKIKNETIKNALLFNASKYGITYTNDLEEFYKMYMAASTNKENKEEITKSYNALKAVTKGNISPKFMGYENNAGGTTSLDDLKGKYVYIDVWATWCGPCIAEIPSLKKVEKKYHKKNIEFVSISIDKEKDHDKWKKMIVDKNLGGMQLYADNDWKSQFIQDYLIKGIPRFILIDPKGNIVSSNAPRPSDKKLTELLDELKI
jgi:thiol-disulfide isomerase/thioredoxin